VLLHFNESFLGEGLEALLQEQPDLRVSRFYSLEDEQIIDMVRKQSPATIILYDSRVNPARPLAERLRAENPNFSIVIINLNTNTVHISSEKEVLLEKSNDLVEEIRAI
jgi:DNA-binding NarL/FixJ family response regulator